MNSAASDRRLSFRHTLCASYLGYVTQAVVIHFFPLLLLTFYHTWGIPLSRLSALLSFNFGIQLLVDLGGAWFVDRIGYRPCIVAAHLLSGGGLICLGSLPFLLPDPYVGLLLSILIYAIGGGLIEMLVSPIVEACPTPHKGASMALLHSFLCWGQVFVILVSTVWFLLCGVESWPRLARLWAVIPFANAIYFCFVPIRRMEEMPAGETPAERTPAERTSLFRQPLFWTCVLLMTCAGASEQAMAQWASALAESGLGVSKTVGDLAGPCLFAAMMGLSRVASAGLVRYTTPWKIMTACCIACTVGYVTVSLAPLPAVSLMGCGLCGLAVGSLWPGAFTMACEGCRGGGTALFAYLALAGDVGCMVAPWWIGYASSLAPGGSLKAGMLAAVIFPLTLLVGLGFCRTCRRGK